MFRHAIHSVILITALGAFSSCVQVPNAPTPTLDSAKTLSIASGCQKMIRFHQGITAFDNVHRQEELPSVNEALLKAITKGVSGRFKVVPAQIPEVYTKRSGGFSRPALPPVQRTDVVLTIMPWLTGTSEPEIATQGYGVRSARIGRGASAFANLIITVYHAVTAQAVATILVSDVCPLVGVDWRSNWAEYSPAERAEIERGLNLIFQRTSDKVKAKIAP